MIVLVSLIIPVCNTEEHLGECLDSVISQTLKDIEIICVNAGLSDDSSNILASYSEANDHVIVIDQKGDMGKATARNIGLENARGEYIFFLDTDNLLFSNDSLKHLHDIALRDKADEVIGATLNWYEESGERLLECHKDYLENNLNSVRFQDHQYLRHNAIAFNKLFKKSLIADNNFQFETDLEKFADSVFSWKAHLLAGKISLTRQATCLHRVRSSLDNESNLLEKNNETACHILAAKYMLDFFDRIPELSPCRNVFDQIFFSWCHLDIQELDTQNLSKLHKKEILENYLSVLSRVQVSSLTETGMSERYVEGLFLIQKGDFEEAWSVFAAENYQALCLRKQLDNVYSSLSWKLTLPLRKIKQIISLANNK